MSFFVTKYPAGTFSWTDMSSTDIEASKKFMTGLMGWTSKDLPTDPGKPDYTMFYLGDKTVAGGMSMPLEMAKAGVPSMWLNYVTVANVDETVTQAEKLGGKVAMPAMDVLDSGRMAGIQDPTGANVMLWQPKNHIGSEVVNTVGAMVWNELYTNDVEAAKEFYGQLFGWTFDAMEGQKEYFIIKNKGRSNGGIMAITPDMMGMPPNWTVYFTVANLDEATKKVTKLGGKVLMTKPIGIGKVGMIADPAGASFIIMELGVPAEEWVDAK